MNGAEAVRPVSGIIPERKRFFNINDRVDPETGDSLVKPPVYHLVNRFPHLRVLPVQIRLFPVKQVKIIQLPDDSDRKSVV